MSHCLLLALKESSLAQAFAFAVQLALLLLLEKESFLKALFTLLSSGASKKEREMVEEK